MESQLGGCLAVLGHVEEARSLLRESHVALAVYSLVEGQNAVNQARQPLRQSIDRLVWFLERCDEPELASAWRTLRPIELDPPPSEQAPQAAATLEDVCREHPDSVDHLSILGIGYYRLATVDQRAKTSEGALSWYSKALDALRHLGQINPDNAVASELIGQCFGQRARLQSKLGRSSEALADYEMALQKRPEDWNLWRDAAWAMADAPEPALRKLERAVALARQVTDHDSDNPSSWRTLGSVQYRAGQWDAAAKSLNRSIELSKGESGPHELLFLAMIHWQLGDQKKARECYQNALTLMKKNRRVAQDLARFRYEAAQLLGLSQRKTAKEKRAEPKRAGAGK